MLLIHLSLQGAQLAHHVRRVRYQRGGFLRVGRSRGLLLLYGLLPPLKLGFLLSTLLLQLLLLSVPVIKCKKTPEKM